MHTESFNNNNFLKKSIKENWNQAVGGMDISHVTYIVTYFGVEEAWLLFPVFVNPL